MPETLTQSAGCTCGAQSVCPVPASVELGTPGDYVVAPGVAAKVEAEVQFNLRHFDREQNRVVHPLIPVIPCGDVDA